MNFNDKMEALRSTMEVQQLEGLKGRGVDCENNRLNHKVKVLPGNKYFKVNVGASGRLMVEKSTEIIYGIKAYGQVHKGHAYGTLDTINDWDWSDYYPMKKGN